LPARGHTRARVIDTHAHLDGCAEPAAELLARARAAGVTRVITIGTGIESCRAALAIAEEHGDVYAALGIDPHQAASAEAERVPPPPGSSRRPPRPASRRNRAAAGPTSRRT